MSSSVDGRCRLAEVTVSGGRMTRARAGEDAAAMGLPAVDETLEI